MEIEDAEGRSVRLAEAESTTKKRAQQDAARIALDRLSQQRQLSVDGIPETLDQDAPR